MVSQQRNNGPELPNICESLTWIAEVFTSAIFATHTNAAFCAVTKEPWALLVGSYIFKRRLCGNFGRSNVWIYSYFPGI